MTGLPSRVALVSLHTSPASQPGTGDAGGMNVVVRSLARELARLGLEVDVMTRAVGTPTSGQLEPGVVLHELSAGPQGPIAKDALADVSDEFGEAVAALAGRAGSRYDIVHAHYWLSGIATLPVALELGIPFVQSFHTLAAMKNALSTPGAPLEPERRLRSESYLAGEASAIVAGSASEATHLIDAVGAPADRVWVIPPGVDVDFFRPNRARDGDRVREGLGIESGRDILVVAGRIQPLKDQELAVRALSLLHMRSAAAPVLVIAGEATPGDEDYALGIRSLAGELGVVDDVRFVGAQSRDALARLFAVATLTLVTSHSETFGLVALESAASGTPVVGFRGSGMLESIAEGVSGVFVDSRDPQDWASAISDLLHDAVGLERLSASARDHALGYTWAASATALLSVYGSL
ncbi:D-inositol-3-phosphate glycosyltransferase [Cryobacterium mesophilum]|uniref:Glycosyltransferase family 1 protein n=1 Tax=Terrimesophilobacter mesophilus TaxID=433647 RepID=A0A4R8V821_9MICO|nr:glycosyltransferase [Terrimesophilobacter mesophilus]MBB5632454.1 D-inositol-3-phosphate glycosyltransferase [Terrimesophilobacter mesophilus]TFB79284.1 glycosyltransferase family 1 protein [Terrimesophilobacter mesophilus]